MATALAASLAALGMTEYKDRVKELAKKRKNSFFLLLMTKLHSVSVLMVLVEMGRVNFFVKDLIPQRAVVVERSRALLLSHKVSL